MNAVKGSFGEKVVILTGASNGIGKTLFLQLAKERASNYFW